MAGRIAIAARLIVAALLLCAGMGSAAHAEKRVALVIGNSNYRAAQQLANPADDARLMSDTLLSLGFFVVGGGARLDLDKAGFDAALREFGDALVGADVALFYYAGHGVETHGLNYLVPVDAHPLQETDVISQMTGLAPILGEMEKSGARVNLLLVDACRDNPFHDHGLSSISGGLAQMQAPPGTLISFATQPHGVALDGDDGHSPYTRALAATMQRQGFGLFKTFNEVGLAVEKATHGQQLPWVSSSPISGSFYFAGKPAIATPASLPAPAAPVDGPAFTPLDDAALRRDLITDCDRLAAMPFDGGHASELPGVDTGKIDVKLAGPACDDAMQRYPDVMRFVLEAGRVAVARKEYAEARNLFERAAAGGYRMGLNNIGALYEGGSGVRPDYVQAANWYRKAVEAGEPIAMIDLGYLYENGLGVAKNCAEAVRLYETAVKAGMPDAMFNLGLLYYNGKCVQRDNAEARRLYEQASNLGNAAAMNEMGAMYNEGAGVARNATIARQWYEKGAALGNATAKENLKEMRRAGR
jgi:TPR repeat protein